MRILTIDYPSILTPPWYTKKEVKAIKNQKKIQQEELPTASDDIPTEISLPLHEKEFEERSYVEDDKKNSEKEAVQEGNHTLPRYGLRDRKPPGYLADCKT